MLAKFETNDTNTTMTSTNCVDGEVVITSMPNGEFKAVLPTGHQYFGWTDFEALVRELECVVSWSVDLTV